MIALGAYFTATARPLQSPKPAVREAAAKA